MATQPKSPEPLYDVLASFNSGINSGVDPLLLGKNQAAFANNGTFRGDFLKQRPGFNTIPLSYFDTPTQTNFQTGLFQAGGYYKPDFGSESIVVVIAGHIFLVNPSAATATVEDISIPTDINSPNQSQGWLCQAENFLIYNDGLALPFFYDGTNSRRSQGASQTLGVTTAAATVPLYGATTQLTLAAAYNGVLNETINIGYTTTAGSIELATYVVTGVGGGGQIYGLTLKNISDTVGITQPAGGQLVIQPSSLGIVNAVPASSNGPPPQFTATMSAAIPTAAVVGSIVTIQGLADWKIKSISVDRITVVYTYIGTGNPFPDPSIVGSTVTLSSGQPNTVVATLAAPFISPPVNSTVAVTIQAAYTNAINQIVFIGSVQYQVISINNTAPTGGTIITVENLTDIPGQSIPIGTILSTIQELPAGRNLVYGMGRVWEAMIDGISFLGGDIVDSSSGSPAYNDRDSVLKITQNQFLNGGGLFRVPGSVGSIQAMKFVAMLDVSLGQGALQIFTPTNVFTCNAPVDDTVWATTTNPILTQALIGSGGISQDSVSPSNGDLIFRSADGLIRSLLLARLDFNQWGNTPISREVTRILQSEDLALLPFSTSCVFDNRFLMGANLVQAGRGVYSTSIVALNFDPISNLQGKSDSIYDGQWQGLNVLKFITDGNGNAPYFNGVQRLFAVCLSQDLTQIEIHEISTTDSGIVLDDGNQVTSFFESPVIFSTALGVAGVKPVNPNHEYLKLSYAEIYVDGLTADVQFQAFWKPDQWPDWVPWYSWTEKYDKNHTGTDPGFRPRIGLPNPTANCFDKTNDRPLCNGFNFQFKLVMTGSCRFLGARFSADIIPQPEFAKPTPK